MNRKRMIAVAIVLALILLIGGMIAYFTDTDTATNEFTLGDEIEISLSETGGWTKNATSGKMQNANAQGIHPGTTVDKAPVVTNDSTTTPAYVFAEVIVPCYDSDDDGVVDAALYTLNTIGSGWNLMSTSAVNTTDKTITYVYNYGDATSMTALAKEASTPAVFSSVTLKSTITAEQAATAPTNPDIEVNAYGIQTDGYNVTAPSQIYALLQ